MSEQRTPAAVLDTGDPAYIHDPYPIVGALREAEPVSHVVIDGLAMWLVTRYEDAVRVLADPRFAQDPGHAGPVARAVPWSGAVSDSVLTRHMLRSDPPDHTRLRRLVVKAFTPRRVAAMEPRVREIAADLLAAMPAGAEVADLVHGYARPLPIIVITELFGVEHEHLADFIAWSDAYVDDPDPVRREAALEGISGVLTALVAKRGAELAGSGLNPDEAPSLLDALIQARDADDRLTTDELLAMSFLILVAGYETTANLIGNGAWLTLSEPGRRDRLAADPALIPAAIEEFLRFEAPVKVNGAVRYASQDMEIAGVPIPAGDAVLVHYGAANRDPRRFPNPDVLDFDRPVGGAEGGHLAFSHGLHYCLGSALARLEARVAFETLLARYPDAEVAVPAEAVPQRASRLIRGVAELPVRLGKPAGGA